MKKSSMLVLSALSLAIATPAWAESPFDGTWKADMKSTQLEEKPSVYELKGGVYHCKTCVPVAVTVKADGAYHPVKGMAYYDAMAVKVVDDKTVTTMRRKGDKMVGETTTQLSSDGNTATFSWNNIGADGTPVTGKGWQKRLSAASEGSHAISGSWMTTGYDNISDSGTIVTFKVDGDTLHMTSPSGESYVAKFDGPAVAINGDDGGTWVKVRKLDASTFEETNLRDGKVIGVYTTWIDADGKTMKTTFDNKLRGTKMTFKSNKQ